MQIPFQWSCHIEHAEGRFEHHSFLDLSGEHLSISCIQRMREVTDENGAGPLVVYYATYEKGRLKELGERHPEHAELMNKYIARLFDLHPLVKQHFYHPAMAGSFSIKKVATLESNLLRYCEQDTWAMVEVAYFLAGKARPSQK